MAASEADLEHLLDYLKRSRGFDFTGYKRASLSRRIAKRMEEVHIGPFSDYLDYLEVHPEEFAALFNTVLINVTSFFRDPDAWEFIAGTVIPDIVARHRSGVAIRVWSAGCASGEEAYTLAMLFADALGPEGFRDTVKIYATDVDEEALAVARAATYTSRDVADVPQPLLDRYFDRSEDRYAFRKDLRRQVIFGRHDLIQDAPISRIDLLVCRNTLMYFNAETQARILTRFQFALNDHGVLFLGRAETMMTHASAFSPLDGKHRISTKLPTRTPSSREQLPSGAQQRDGPAGAKPIGRTASEALDAAPTAQLLVDLAGMLTFANARARALFGISPGDVGSSLSDPRISQSPLDLRAAIDQACVSLRPVLMPDVELVRNAETRSFDVQVAPLVDSSGAPIGASVVFQESTTTKRLRIELARTTRELDATREQLQSANEDLETTNEKLQSTVAELETMNEALESTNEELATMNEELQSTNQELQTMNDEIRLRSEELAGVSTVVESILASIRSGVIVLDRDLAVLAWNDAGRELCGLRVDEASGKNLLSLAIGMPVQRLEQPIRACLGGLEQASLTLGALDRRGETIEVAVIITPLLSTTETIIGVIIRMEPLTSAAVRSGDDQAQPGGVSLMHAKRTNASRLER